MLLSTPQGALNSLRKSESQAALLVHLKLKILNKRAVLLGSDSAYVNPWDSGQPHLDWAAHLVGSSLVVRRRPSEGTQKVRARQNFACL